MRSDPPPARLEDRPLPEFLPHVPPPGPHAPIEREIERSERASAALAATRALARAAFTDSQLAAEDAAADAEFDNSGWVRTEYAAFDHQVIRPEDGSTPVDPPRNLVGGSFNPGIAAPLGRPFVATSIADTPIKTRTGAQARFHQESRRAERAAPAPAKVDPAPVSANIRDAAQTPRAADESFRISLGASAGVVGLLIGVGVVLKAGLLSNAAPAAASAPAAVPAAPIPAATAVPAPLQEPASAPTAGVESMRSPAEVNAALAAAARAAAVPMASVHAAGPSRVARPLPASLPRAKDGVASAIAQAQARADRFLATDGAKPAAAVASEVNQAP